MINNRFNVVYHLLGLVKLLFYKLKKMKKMKIAINYIMCQLYLTPYIKVTHDHWLNGNKELIIGWLKWEICILKEASYKKVG
jgi:hypothetical protein